MSDPIAFWQQSQGAPTGEPEVVSAAAFMGEILDFRFHKKPPKYPLPFKQEIGVYKGQIYDFDFRPGELTVWAGENGCGKSMLTGQIALHLANKGAKIMIGSYEMEAYRTMDRLCSQALHNHSLPPATEERTADFIKWTADKIFIHNIVGRLEFYKVRLAIETAKRQFGCDVVIIDSLTVFEESTDFNRTRELMYLLCAAAKEENVHIILVAHMRKKAFENLKAFDLFAEVQKENIRGTSVIADAAFNVFCMARNKPKLRARSQGLDVDDSKPDLLLNLCKQRNGSWEGYINLYFDSYSLQYLTNPRRSPSILWNDDPALKQIGDLSNET